MMVAADTMLEAWRCSGTLKDGRPCRRILLEIDRSRPSLVRKICDRCGTVNTLDLDSARP